MNNSTHTPDAINPVSYSRADNSVHVAASFVATCATLPAIEAICKALATADPENNPCGLFCHPQTEAETILVFGAEVMLHQAALAQLIEELFVSCNYPLHIRVETDATEPVTAPLAEQVKRHLTPQSRGGYMDDSGPPSSWEWRCNVTTQPDVTALDSFKAAGGSVTLITS